MNITSTVENLKKQHDVVGVINLAEIFTIPIYSRNIWLEKQLSAVYKQSYTENQRIVFQLETEQHSDAELADVLTELYRTLYAVDISNFFVIVATDRPSILDIHKTIKSQDPIPTTIIVADVTASYNSNQPIGIDIKSLKDDEKFLLLESKTFCMYPWIHVHAYPTGDAYPCCMAEMKYPIGNCRTTSLEKIWNDTAMRDIRLNMLSNQPVKACMKCYEQEDAGFLSGRVSANKHHGHHISRVKQTKDDGSYDDFNLVYWDIRFSNLCNLSCRSCGHIFSSSWYQDQAKLAGEDWAQKNKVLNYAGRTETDIWEQLIPHLDYVEQIYFAGGEPLMMEEHYNILEELERRGRFDVRLIYNTNFTHVKLKDRYVFDYWRKFNSVAVGASLDAMGPRAEYIRRGTNWDTVERNRERMLQDCPNVDFYISPTLSILNALHLPDFHRKWVDQGFIRAQDLNVNILQDPPHFRIDIATPKYKQQIKNKFQEHLAWLRPLDHLQRATVGFESAIKFMDAIDNTHLLEKFWTKTDQLDDIRRENVLEIIPELTQLK